MSRPENGSSRRSTFGRIANARAFVGRDRAALCFNVSAAVAVVAGLIPFGVIFALNSAVRSYLILAYTERDKVSMSVGVYYTANPCARLPTVLSGLVYQLARAPQREPSFSRLEPRPLLRRYLSKKADTKFYRACAE